MMTTYKLNSEVTTATPSLLQAAQIGELSYENPTLQHLENKDAILVMSFGTTFKGPRKATIQATVDQIQALHPNTKISLAFTSHIVIDRVKEHEGLRVPIPEEALDRQLSGTVIALVRKGVLLGSAKKHPLQPVPWGKALGGSILFAHCSFLLYLLTRTRGSAMP